jgi:hypothetical protein
MTVIWAPSIRRVTRYPGQLESDADLSSGQACQAGRIDHPFYFNGSAPGGQRGRSGRTGAVCRPREDQVLVCDMADLYDGEQMRAERLEAWQALRERYGNRDESRVDHGTLRARLPESS